MNNAAAVSKFISELAMHFPPPMRQKDEPQAYTEWLRTFLRAMSNYSQAVIERSAQEIINTRTDRRFPLVSEVKKVCDKHASEEYRERNAKPLTDTAKVSQSQFSDWRVKLADDLIMCGLGKEAARDGWILSLHDFCRAQGRLPTGHEVGQCKAAAKGFDAAYEACLRGEGGVCNAALVKLGDSMLARREEYRARVLGREAA